MTFDVDTIRILQFGVLLFLVYRVLVVSLGKFIKLLFHRPGPLPRGGTIVVYSRGSDVIFFQVFMTMYLNCFLYYIMVLLFHRPAESPCGGTIISVLYH